jgi:hypothetical protein
MTTTCRCGVYEWVHREGRGCGNFRKASRVHVWLRTHSIWQHVAAPVWLRVPERHRWTIVTWLNKSRRRCWSDLVSDALTVRTSDCCDTYVPSLLGERNPACASVCGWGYPAHTGEHPCSCYCGKFQFTATEGSCDRSAVGSD